METSDPSRSFALSPIPTETAGRRSLFYFIRRSRFSQGCENPSRVPYPESVAKGGGSSQTTLYRETRGRKAPVSSRRALARFAARRAGCQTREASFCLSRLRAVFAEGNQTARRGSRGSPRASSFAPFLDGQERGPAEQKLTLFGRWDKITVRMFAAERN